MLYNRNAKHVIKCDTFMKVWLEIVACKTLKTPYIEYFGWFGRRSVFFKKKILR